MSWQNSNVQEELERPQKKAQSHSTELFKMKNSGSGLDGNDEETKQDPAMYGNPTVFLEPLQK